MLPKNEGKNQNSAYDNGLGDYLKSLVHMTKLTIQNSADYASRLIKEGKYEEAKVYLKNALEGIEILEG